MARAPDCVGKGLDLAKITWGASKDPGKMKKKNPHLTLYLILAQRTRGKIPSLENHCSQMLPPHLWPNTNSMSLFCSPTAQGWASPQNLTLHPSTEERLQGEGVNNGKWKGKKRASDTRAITPGALLVLFLTSYVQTQQSHNVWWIVISLQPPGKEVTWMWKWRLGPEGVSPSRFSFH